MPPNDSLMSLRRRAALDEIQSLGVFTSIRWIEETDSTNRQLSSEIRSGAIRSPALLVADRQSGGKGRGGNLWFSPPGCLMLTMAVPFNIPFNSVSFDNASSCATGPMNLLPLEIGVAIAQSLAPLCRYRPQVKWPNDVYILDRKVCGILIEVVQVPSEETTGRLDESRCEQGTPSMDRSGDRSGDATRFYSGQWVAIIGVGVNCQVDFSRAESDVQQRATSVHLMSRQTEEECSPEDVLVQFLQTWQSLRLASEANPQWLLECWKDWSFLEGKWVTVEKATTLSATTVPQAITSQAVISQTSRPQSLEGLCLGIDSNGALRLATSAGQVISVIAGSVVSFRDA